MARIALVREVSDSIADCELTHLARAPIDPGRAREQHAAYCAALQGLGCELRPLPALPRHPDAVFVEDCAVVLDELAVATRPGAESRRGEVASVAAALAAFRPLAWIEAPGTLDGGDVLAVGRTLFVGATPRSNAAGIAQLAAAVAPLGYAVVTVPVSGCLHLKTAATEVAPGLVLVNPAWVEPGAFVGLDHVAVDPVEAAAANALRVGEAVLYPAAFPRTAARLEARGLRPLRVPADELAKAEGGVTCCSIVFEA